jgi:hypothetical protein
MGIYAQPKTGKYHILRGFPFFIMIPDSDL